MRWIERALLFAALVLVATGCPDSSDRRASAIGSRSSANDAVKRALDRCELLDAEGELRVFSVGAIGEREACRARCVEEATCAQIEAWACGGTGDTSECLMACLTRFSDAIEGRYMRCVDGGDEFSPRQHCDGVFDCRDGTDERDCHESPFVCEDGRDAVSASQVCDLFPDCSDASDELACARLACPGDGADVWTFENISICPGTWVLPCDRGEDCACPEFGCGSGETISQALVCDFVDDCADASDEARCGDYGKPSFTCRGEDKRLPETFLCDGTRDCKDGSDEQARACMSVHDFPD